MSLTTQYDEREVNESYTGVATAIPASPPYRVRLAEVPDQVEGVTITRIGTTSKTGTGSGSCTSGGHYTGAVDRSYRVQIDTAGDIGGTATFKWSRDGGSNWIQSGVPIPDTSAITLENGITVTFGAGAGQDFDLNDYWDFTAEYWTVQLYVPTQTQEVMISYVTGDLTFHSDDASKTVKVSYEGRGSLVDAEDVNNLKDAIEAGALKLCGIDTSSFSVGDPVYISAADTFGQADATDDTKPAVGMVSVVGATDGEVVIIGVVSGLTGLTPNQRYYLAAAEVLLTFDDCGDSDTVTDWAESDDALNPEQDVSYVRDGDYSMKLSVDADASGNDDAMWTLTRTLKDLSSYSSDWIYLWVYLPTLDYLLASGTALRFEIGSDATHRLYFDWTKAQLSVGWNLLKCDLDNPAGSEGTPDWANTDWGRITINEVASNTNDFDVYVDSIKVVKPRPGEYVSAAPTGGGNIVQFIGRALSTTKMLVRISEEYVTL